MWLLSTLMNNHSAGGLVFVLFFAWFCFEPGYHTMQTRLFWTSQQVSWLSLLGARIASEGRRAHSYCSLHKLSPVSPDRLKRLKATLLFCPTIHIFPRYKHLYLSVCVLYVYIYLRVCACVSWHMCGKKTAWVCCEIISLYPGKMCPCQGTFLLV